MTAMASQITSLTIVYLIVYSGTDQIKHQSSTSLAFVWGSHRGPATTSRVLSCISEYPIDYLHMASCVLFVVFLQYSYDLITNILHGCCNVIE